MGRNERDEIASEILRAHDLKQMQIDEEAARTLKASQAQEEEVRSALWRAFELATLKALERLRSNDWPNPTILTDAEIKVSRRGLVKKIGPTKRYPGWLVEEFETEVHDGAGWIKVIRAKYLLSSGEFFVLGPRNWESDVSTSDDPSNVSSVVFLIPEGYSPHLSPIYSRLEFFEIYRANVPRLIPKLNRLATLE